LVVVKKLMTFGVLIAVVLGVRAVVEREATRMLGVAQEMYEDGELERSLEKVREIEKYFGWTEACDNSMALREEIREAIKKQRAQQEIDAWSRKTQQEHEKWMAQQEAQQLQREKMEHQKEMWELEMKKAQQTPTPRSRGRY
jgi:hypothetical protein